MSHELKIILGLTLVTLGIVIGGIFLLNQSSSPTIDHSALIRAESHQQVAKEPQVTVVEFGDFQCPSCAAIYPDLKNYLSQHQENVTFVFRHFPLPQHQNALAAAVAAEAAGQQNKFWEMSDLLFTHQSDWAELADPTPIFLNYAQQLGLAKEPFQTALLERTYSQKVYADKADGNQLSVNATPTFFVNGKVLVGPTSQELLDAIQQALN